MALLMFYNFTRLLSLLGSMATLVVLIAMGHQYWAIFPAVLAIVMAMSISYNNPGSLDV